MECTDVIISTSVCITTYNYHSYCYDKFTNTIITNLPKSKYVLLCYNICKVYVFMYVEIYIR